MIRNMRSAAAGALILAAATVAVPAPVRAGIVEDGKAMIATLSSEVIAIVGRGGASQAERERRFERLFRSYFDAAAIGRWVMGRGWRRASAAQRASFQALFAKYIAKTYAIQLSKYTGERFRVVGAEPDRSGVAVISHITGGTRPVVLKWRLRPDGDALKVRDVVINNISMSLNQRREFASVLARRGSVDGLLAALRGKIAQLEKR